MPILRCPRCDHPTHTDFCGPGLQGCYARTNVRMDVWIKGCMYDHGRNGQLKAAARDKLIDQGRYSRYDGGLKDVTKDCATCEHRYDCGRDSWCCWGVALKQLVACAKPRKCEYTDKPSSRVADLEERGMI
jgi:hypothetical protein